MPEVEMMDRFGNSLGILWLLHGEPMEKTAAEGYFYNLRKPALDREALGAHFCKVAGELHQDPWILAWSVKENLPAYRQLAKTASNPKSRRLAQYYVDWAEETEKRAFLGAIKGGLKAFGGKAMQGAKSLATKAKGMFAHGKPPVPHPATAVKPGAVAAKPAATAAPKPTPTSVQAAPPATPAATPAPPPGLDQGAMPTSSKEWRKANVLQRQGQEARAAAAPKPGAAERAAAQREASIAKTETPRGGRGGRSVQRDKIEQGVLKDTLKKRQIQRGVAQGKTEAQAANDLAKRRKVMRQKAKVGPDTSTFGHKLLGGAAIGTVPAAMMMGGGPQMEQAQAGYPQSYPQGY